MSEESGSRSGLEGERIEKALAAFFDDVEAGRRPDPRRILAEHPEFERDASEVFTVDRLLAGWAAGPRRGEAPPDSSLPWEFPGAGAIGGHRLLEEIGRGGMGVVFRAWHRDLRRVVALKAISAGRLASDAERRRFRAEAEAAATLEHPNIVPIHEIGRDQGCLFYTMRLLEGGSLSRRLHEFPSRPRDGAQLVMVIARAIHHAHQRGVLHRDLKPSNILLDARGAPHVNDFGLAKRSGGPDLTLTGEVLGSPSYMAPEQADGRGGTTVATDVHGLGAVLYALLLGRPPFEAESAIATLDLVRGRPPEPPRASNPRVDRDLQTICLKCLEKDPEARYATARDLADDLRRWLDGEPIRARAASPLRRAWLWSRRPLRRRDAAVLALTIGLFLSAFDLLGVAMIGAGEIPSPDPMTQVARLGGWLLLACLPMAAWAWGALRGRAWAFWGGLAHALLMGGLLFAFLPNARRPGRDRVDAAAPVEELLVHGLTPGLFGLLALAFAAGAVASTVERRRDGPGRDA